MEHIDNRTEFLTIADTVLKSIPCSENRTMDSDVYSQIQAAIQVNGQIDWTAIAKLDTQMIQNEYVTPSFVGFQTLAIWSTNSIVNLILSLKPRAAIKNGWKIIGTDNDERIQRMIEYKVQWDKTYDIRTIVLNKLRSSLQYGGCLSLFSVEGMTLEEEFNEANIRRGAYKGVILLDPITTIAYTTSESLNPLGGCYYEPTYYSLQTVDRYINATHIFKLVPFPVAAQLRPTYRYFGVSVTQMIYNYVRNYQKATLEIDQLLETKRTNVLYIDKLMELQNQESVQQRLQQFVATRSNYGVTLLSNGGGNPAEAEKLELLDTGLTDVATVIDKALEAIAVASGDPITKIIGSLQKGGLGNAGTFDLETWHENVAEMQSLIIPFLERHYRYAYISEFGEEPPMFSIEFEPVADRSPEQEGVILNSKADYLTKLQQSGIINDTEARIWLQNDTGSGFNSINPFSVEEMEGLYEQALGGFDVEEGKI